MTDEKNSARSRFGNVVHRDDVREERWQDEGGRYGVAVREVAVALGTKDLGYSLVSLDPGKKSCPYHFHHLEEEAFFVLEGSGLLRQGDAEGEEEIEVRAGDFVSFPPGTGIAHHFRNPGDGPFVYLAFSTRSPHEVAEYPDSDKVLVRSAKLVLRRGPKLDYFDGET